MLKRWLEKLSGSNTLYYPGCVTHYALPDIERRYEELLRRSGVDFIMLPGEVLCCGSPVKRAGYHTDFEELKVKNLAIFARFSVRKIITNCPGCYHTLKHDYKLEAYHVAQVLSPDWLTEASGGRAADETSSIAYHDPCHLGRWSGIYDEPRQLLASAGWAVAELPDNREQSLCCGTGGGVKPNFPDLANAIARQRLAQVVGATGSGHPRLCTACPLCYAHFKENANGVEVLEFSQALTLGRVPGNMP
jgi:Fe-S oxidoreductase